MHAAEHGGYLICDDPALLDVDAIHAFLVGSYWAAGIPRAVVARAIANSLCLGIYTADRRQVGFVRIITDYATFAYLCDVYVLPPHRGQGLAKAALALFESHPRLQGLRRKQLVTADAHALYANLGFRVVNRPGDHMEKHDPQVYAS